MPENQSKDPPEDEAEERHDRWLFNGVVFFLVVPFIVVSLGTGSTMALGFGLALIVWRVALTPEITNRISSNMSSWLRRFLRNLVTALVTGLILLGVSDYVTGDSFSGAIGFPLSYTYPISGCNGLLRVACVAIDSPVVVLDYLLWVALSLVIMSLIGWTATRWSFFETRFSRTDNTQMTR